MGLLGGIFGKGFRVSISAPVEGVPPTFTYREGKRTMRIMGENLADGYAIYSATIKEWESRPDEAVDEAEKQRIASNLQQYLTSKGKHVYLS